MSTSVDIQLNCDDSEESIGSVKIFFAPIASVQITKVEQKAIKSWDKAIEIILTIVGTWASEKYILDPLADKAGEWLHGIRDFWGRSGFQHKVNVIIKFQQDNFEIQFISTHEPEVLKQVWKVARDVIELLEKQNVRVDTIRITTNSDKSLLIIGYSGSQPKYTINLDEKSISQIKSSSSTHEDELNPEVEIWVLAQLERRLEYLKSIKQKGHDVPDSEIPNLEKEILDRKEKLST